MILRHHVTSTCIIVISLMTSNLIVIVDGSGDIIHQTSDQITLTTLLQQLCKVLKMKYSRYTKNANKTVQLCQKDMKIENFL